MTYALDRGLFLEDGPALNVANAATARSSARLRSWRTLAPDHRLAVIDHALAAASGELADGLPAAL